MWWSADSNNKEVCNSGAAAFLTRFCVCVEVTSWPAVRKKVVHRRIEHSHKIRNRGADAFSPDSSRFGVQAVLAVVVRVGVRYNK